MLFKVRMFSYCFRESFSYFMNIVCHRVHLCAILNKPGHFLLPKRTFSYDPATKSFSIYSVILNLKVFKKQNQAAQFPVKQLGEKR